MTSTEGSATKQANFIAHQLRYSWKLGQLQSTILFVSVTLHIWTENLKEYPQISNIALSGMVCFINNKTPQYLESLSEEERHKLIERAVK